MKKYNILFFTSFGSMKGGGQRSLYYLIQGLDKNIFNPIVVCPEIGEFINSLEEIGVETLVIPYRRFRHFSFAFIRKLSKVFKEKDISIVDTDASAETFYCGIAARMSGIPLVWHIRVSSHKIVDRIIDRFIPYLCTKLILVAQELGKRFYWLRTSDKLVFIHNAIDIEEFNKFPVTNIREEIGIDENSVIIGCIGRIEGMKGQECLIRAVSDVSKVAGNFHLLFVGEKDILYYEKVKKLISRFRLDKKINFTGYRKDSLGIVKGIDILVLSSSFGEGLSRVILEAMAASKPIITTDVGGNSEAVINGENGYVVPPKDDKSLANAILNLLGDPEKRKEMGAAGRKRVEKLFAMEENVKKTEALYLDILKEKGRLT